MVTAWIVDQVNKRVSPSPFSTEVEELVEKYATPEPEADRQIDELALVTGYALLMIPAVALWGFLAWVSSDGHHTFNFVARIGWGTVVVLLVGIGLHLIRYYDALIGKHRRRARVEHWPRLSGDLDFVVQIAFGLLAALLAT